MDKKEDKQARPSVISKDSSLLMSTLAARATDRGESPMDLSAHLGIGYVYLMQLLSGKRDTAALSRKVLIACAQYLDIPVAEAYLLAGAIEPTDFVHDGKFQDVKGESFDTMASHPFWGGFMPTRAEWNAMPDRCKLLVMFAFEQATEIKLIDDADKTMIPV